MNTKVWYLPYFEGVYHTRMIETYSNVNARMVHTMVVNRDDAFVQREKNIINSNLVISRESTQHMTRWKLNQISQKWRFIPPKKVIDSSSRLYCPILTYS